MKKNNRTAAEEVRALVRHASDDDARALLAVLLCRGARPPATRAELGRRVLATLVMLRELAPHHEAIARTVGAELHALAARAAAPFACSPEAVVSQLLSRVVRGAPVKRARFAGPRTAEAWAAWCAANLESAATERARRDAADELATRDDELAAVAVLRDCGRSDAAEIMKSALRPRARRRSTS